MNNDRPKVVTLCGSTRFTSEMLREAWRLTLAGNIVIHWNVLEGREAFAHGAEREGPEVKNLIDALYLHKVAMADEVRVIDVGGYIGESTTREVVHAMKLGKPVSWLAPLTAESSDKLNAALAQLAERVNPTAERLLKWLACPTCDEFSTLIDRQQALLKDTALPALTDAREYPSSAASKATYEAAIKAIEEVIRP